MGETGFMHTFHIPVMGTGFTLDSPVRVARYGISSVISLVDDEVIEQVRARLCAERERPYEPLSVKDEDARARRITAYLDLLNELVREDVERLRLAPFGTQSDLDRYFELLPEGPLRSRYQSMLGMSNCPERAALEAELRAAVVPGTIDVNIMTKLDRDTDAQGEALPAGSSAALAALRGFAQSSVDGGVVFSAGMNTRLYGYVASFDDFFPDAEGHCRKRVILKVSSYRSAEIQGRFLAKRGVWVSEHRIESGLNCGGHAFAGEGSLIGPTLAEFAEKRDSLSNKLFATYQKALSGLGRPVPACAPEMRVTVQGGIGTAAEDRLLRETYGADGTGWATPFLLVPEATAVDKETRARLLAARVKDIQLSPSSPLGVPFWNLMTSGSEEERRRRISDGRPGSPCPLGHLASSTEFGQVPFCTASRSYQKQKLATLEARGITSDPKPILSKSCICNDLGGAIRLEKGITKKDTPAICPGPNLVNFKRLASLSEMVGHIYGRGDLVAKNDRPHMFIRELELSLDYLRNELDVLSTNGTTRSEKDLDKFRQRLLEGVAHYRTMTARVSDIPESQWLSALDRLEGELDAVSRKQAKQLDPV